MDPITEVWLEWGAKIYVEDRDRARRLLMVLPLYGLMMLTWAARYG